MLPEDKLFAKPSSMTTIPAVLLMAKAPSTHAKTRLNPALSPAQRAVLVEAMLQDTFLLVAQAAQAAQQAIQRVAQQAIQRVAQQAIQRVAQVGPALRLVVAAAPSPAHPDFQRLHAWWTQEGISAADVSPSALTLSFCAQGEGSLGDRLVYALESVERAPMTPVLILGSDSPSLPPSLLLLALEHLKQVDVVLAPSLDGGYVLLGLKQVERAAFEHIPWSTPEVLEQTVRQLRAAGRTVALLPLWYDVDEPEDLVRLHRQLRTLHLLGETSRAPHTLHVLNTVL
ncbi:MAG: DUF2064 domain-containing protein [Myxococcota bacterium]